MSVPMEFIAGIIGGEYDDDLERIRASVRERERFVRDQQASQNLYTLKQGARVRLKGLTPKYLNGLQGVVTDVGRRGSRRITVTLDRPVPRFGATVNPPASCVEAI